MLHLLIANPLKNSRRRRIGSTGLLGGLVKAESDKPRARFSPGQSTSGGQGNRQHLHHLTFTQPGTPSPLQLVND